MESGSLQKRTHQASISEVRIEGDDLASLARAFDHLRRHRNVVLQAWLADLMSGPLAHSVDIAQMTCA